MKRWVISDTHFCHERIIGYCQRPFKTTDEMNDVLIRNWNSVVSKDDIVYVLGDFCFGNKSTLVEVVKQLKGRKILVLGNHDRLPKGAYLDAGFEGVTKNPIIMDSDFILSHRPLQGDLGKFYNIHGHRHKLPTECQLSPAHFDIGVDDHNFFPHNLDTVIKALYGERRKNCRTKTVRIQRRSLGGRVLALFRSLFKSV